MQNTRSGGTRLESTDRNGGYRMVVCDLAAVIGRVRTSLHLVESEIARRPDAEEADIIVLDDVTPGFARAQAALRECEAGLNAALRLLQEPAPSDNHTCEATERLLPAH